MWIYMCKKYGTPIDDTPLRPDLLVDGVRVINGGYDLHTLPNGNLAVLEPGHTDYTAECFKLFNVHAQYMDYNEAITTAKQKILALPPEHQTLKGFLATAEAKERQQELAEYEQLLRRKREIEQKWDREAPHRKIEPQEIPF